MQKLFLINTVIKQGDALSTLLFNMVLHYAIGKLETGGTNMKKSYQLYAYADDIVILSRTTNKMVKVFLMLEDEASKVGLMVNESKTKYLKLSRSTNVRSPRNLVINNYVFEGVTNYKYLGSLVNGSNNIAECIQDRIQFKQKIV